MKAKGNGQSQAFGTNIVNGARQKKKKKEKTRTQLVTIVCLLSVQVHYMWPDVR
jgi:hypothetical protein